MLEVGAFEEEGSAEKSGLVYIPSLSEYLLIAKAWLWSPLAPPHSTSTSGLHRFGGILS
jgi:hypothetical protein